MSETFKITVDVEADLADRVTVQNLKQFYEAMLNDTDDDSVELRVHVKYTLKAFMTHNEFEEYMEKIWNREEWMVDYKKTFIGKLHDD